MADAVIERMKIEVLLDGKKTFVGLKELQKRMGAIQKTGKKLSSAFKPFLKFAGIAAFGKMAIDAAAFGRSLGLVADKTGIAASKLSSMRNAFAAVGGKAESVDNLLSNITSGLARLSMGDGAMAGKLSAMGISAWDESGNTKGADVVMGDLADWTKSQLAMGRSMAEVSTYLHDNFGIEQDLVNELAMGRAGMEKARREREEQTGSLSNTAVANLESLNKSFAMLKTTIGVLVDKIMAGLAPVIEFFTDLMTILFRGLQDVWEEVEIVFGSIFGEGEEIASLFNFLKDVIGGLIDALKIAIDIIGFVFGIIRQIGEAIGEVVAGVVKAIMVAIDGIKSAIDWFRNSWLGKKIFGGDEEEKEEEKKKEENKEERKVDKLFKDPEPLTFPEIGKKKEENKEEKEVPIIIDTGKEEPFGYDYEQAEPVWSEEKQMYVPKGEEGAVITNVFPEQEPLIFPELFSNEESGSVNLEKTNSRGDTTININVDSKQDVSGGNAQETANAIEENAEKEANMIGDNVYMVLNGGV